VALLQAAHGRLRGHEGPGFGQLDEDHAAQALGTRPGPPEQARGPQPEGEQQAAGRAQPEVDEPHELNRHPPLPSRA